MAQLVRRFVHPNLHYVTALKACARAGDAHKPHQLLLRALGPAAHEYYQVLTDERRVPISMFDTVATALLMEDFRV